MNATATTARPASTDLDGELDRLLAAELPAAELLAAELLAAELLAAEPARTPVAASPLCLCWPDGE